MSQSSPDPITQASAPGSGTDPAAAAAPGAAPAAGAGAGGTQRPRWWSLLAVVLVAALPSVAVVNAFYFELGAVGKFFFLLAKGWALAVPIVWLMLVERVKLELPRPRVDGLFAGALCGLAMFGTILGAFAVVTPHLDREALQVWAREVRIDNPLIFIGAGLAYCLANALMEEFVWRWFVFTRVEECLGGSASEGARPARAGIPLGGATWITAVLFTLHHALALNARLDWRLTIAASAGVLVAGVVWSAMFRRYRSVWPGYVAHILADAGIFVGLWPLLFG